MIQTTIKSQAICFGSGQGADAMRMQLFLSDHRVSFETIYHPPAYTSINRAKRLVQSGVLVAKSVVLKINGGSGVAVLPSTRHVDLHGLSRRLKQPVQMATSDEISGIFRDCEWGATVPFGSLYGISTLLDDTFPLNALVTFPSHSHFSSVRMPIGEFERLEKPKRIRLSC